MLHSVSQQTIGNDVAASGLVDRKLKEFRDNSVFGDQAKVKSWMICRETRPLARSGSGTKSLSKMALAHVDRMVQRRM